MQILIVEDDRDIASLLGRAFEMEGFGADCVHGGSEAIETASRPPFGAIVLDVTLPGPSGFEVCRHLRAGGPNQRTPIILLSARDGVADKVEGLSAGADDYMTKPFAFEELLARVRAQTRERKAHASAASPVSPPPGVLTLDPKLRSAEMNGRRVTLTAREYKLLELFVRHEGKLLTRAQVLEALWDESCATSFNVVDVYVGYLRRKLEQFGSGRRRSLIRTVRGAGYVLSTGGV